MNEFLNVFCGHLIVLEQGGVVRVYPLNEELMIIGRSSGANDIGINSPIVSSQQGVITRENGNYYYADLGSTNGTIIGNRHLRGDMMGGPSEKVLLKDGDVLTIGANQNDRVFLLFNSNHSDNVMWSSISLKATPSIAIGRGLENNIIIPNINVSRQHARITVSNNAVFIEDLHSANGTILNGAPLLNREVLQNGSIIQLPSTKMIRLDDYIVFGIPIASASNDVQSYTANINSKKIEVESYDKYKYAQNGGVQVVVENISRLVPCKKGTGINGSNKKYILSNVSLTINPGELVAVLGGSGAGKTTFMNCINGFEPATEGRVLINGTDLYKNYQSVKSSIGYVPQQDIVHDNLTLEDMLTYTGKLRLPADITKNELSQRVAEVLDMVDLTQQKDTFIKKLSGGQRKRASIAVELVSDPTLFFLDEPPSGLDPEAETNLMHQLKGLSSQKGKTVIVITHTLQNIQLFDKVIFLAPGGKLCYYGSPKGACKFFEVDNLTDAYEKISQDIDGYVNKFAKKGAAV